MSETSSLTGKRLLVLGGTPQQLKLVEAAHSLGVYVIVADWLETSPTKASADKAYVLDIKDVDGIVAMAKSEQVDGVVCGWIDPAQRPYQQVCSKLNVPCYGSAEQFRLMTDKRAFKAMCIENGVEIIPSFSEADVKNRVVDFPVFVKPSDSRGSRGQAVCASYDELDCAIVAAKDESSDGHVVIERYMGGCQEFQATYFFVDGEAYLVRTADSFTGSEANGLEKVVHGAISPSRFTELFLCSAHSRVVKMLKNMGFTNGPAFMQGFVDGDKFRFFDPGLRFPGVDYERILKKATGVDLPEALVRFALTGQMPKVPRIENAALLGGRAAAVLFPTIKPGVVGDLSAVRSLNNINEVVTCILRVAEGERIGLSCDVNQRLAEIDVLASNYSELADEIEQVNKKLNVMDEKGEDMILETFDPAVLKKGGYAMLDQSRECNFSNRVQLSSLLLNRSDLLKAWGGDVSGLLEAVEYGFREFAADRVILPEKASQVFDDVTQSRINCMPSTVRTLGKAGVKWVSVFPENPKKLGMRNVGGVMVLSSMENGSTVSVMDASMLTALRTAAVDALAARYLAKSKTRSLALVGTGEQAAFHARMIAPKGSGVVVRVSGRTPDHADTLAKKLCDEGIQAESMGSDMAKAVFGADIIVTAISGQAPVLKADWIEGGTLYCHVGGWEDEYDVPRKADMIVCDDWHALKHRGSPTIARMFEKGLLTDNDVHANLYEIITGEKQGRLNDNQFIYFNAIGLSYIDVSVATWLYNRAKAMGLGQTFDFSNEGCE